MCDVELLLAIMVCVGTNDYYETCDGSLLGWVMPSTVKCKCGLESKAARGWVVSLLCQKQAGWLWAEGRPRARKLAMESGCRVIGSRKVGSVPCWGGCQLLGGAGGQGVLQRLTEGKIQLMGGNGALSC